MARYTKEQLGKCFPHKSEDWHRRTADDLNSVHAHVDKLEEQGLSGEDAWAETIRLMRAQREAARSAS